MKKNKFKIKKNDDVIILSGKNKGKIGKVITVYPIRNKVLVKGINIAKKHTKASEKQTAGIIDKEMPIHVSNVAFYDKELKKGIKIGFSTLKDGTKIRVNRKTNKEIS